LDIFKIEENNPNGEGKRGVEGRFTDFFGKF